MSESIKDVYQIVTDRIVSIMEQGEIPWEQEWVNTLGTNVAVSHRDGETYSLLNQMLLGIPGEWLTFKQAEAEGGHVKKGAKSRPIVYFKWLERTKTDRNGKPILKDGQEVKESVPLLKRYTVFHTEDCEGIERKYLRTDESHVRSNDPIQVCEEIVRQYLCRCCVTVKTYEQGRSYYSLAEDAVVMPHIWQFESSEGYYSTLFHEMIHSTGSSSRLNRIRSASFADEAYGKEELVAEIGAAMLCKYAGIQSHRTETNSAAYLQNWLKAIRGDKRMIVFAAAQAEKAVKYVLGIENGT